MVLYNFQEKKISKLIKKHFGEFIIDNQNNEFNLKGVPSYVKEDSYNDLTKIFEKINFREKYNISKRENNLIVNNIMNILILSRYDFRNNIELKVINDKIINENFSSLTKNLLMFLNNQKDANKIIVLFSKILAKIEKFKYESNW